MNMYTYIRKYVRLYIQTHIQTEIYIIESVLYVVPERDVPVREYAIGRNVESRDWPFPKWNICYMSIIMYNYLIFLWICTLSDVNM